MSVGRPLLKALLEVVVNPVGAIGHLSDAVFASRDRRAAVQALFDEPEPWTPERSPAALLDADRGVVPFHAGREHELADLDAWLDDPEGLRLMLRLYVAAGGYGKTRLLRELVKRRRGDEKTRRERLAELLRGERWDAGFLRDAATAPDFAPLLAGRRPLLLVLDYAESRSAQIRALVAAARAAKRRRVRLVLLARSEAGWWEELKTADDGVGELFLGRAVEAPRKLGPVADTPALHRTAFDAAAVAFARALGKVPPASAPPLDDPAFERILLVHARALAAVEGEPEVPSAGLLEWLVARERRGLDRAAERLGLPETARPAVHRAAALVTLALGADSLPELQEIVARTPDLPADAVAPCAEALRLLYRGNRWCEGVQPDLVGEHLVNAELTAAEANGDPRLLAAAFGEGVTPPLLEAGLKVLTRLANRAPLAERHLEAVFRLRPLEALAEAAIIVAQAERDPVGRLLSKEIKTLDDPALARHLLPKLPESTTALREVALEVTVQVHRWRSDQLDPTSAEHALELISLKNGLSKWLAASGRHDEGLEVIQEAVSLCQRWAESDPASFSRARARSLTNLANRLLRSGRRNESLAAIHEAVSIRRELAVAGPELEPALARSLTNLSNLLALKGDRDEALRAVEEAVEIRERLVAKSGTAHGRDLANSLNYLANRLTAVGHREDGLVAIERSVEILESLSGTRGEAFEPDLARGLSHLSNHLARAGRHEEGLEAIRKAVAIRDKLSSARSGVFELAFATSLANQSSRLGEMGKHDEALADGKRAWAIRRRWARQHRRLVEPDLATSLHSLSLDLAAVGQRRRALAAARKAVAIRRRLAASDPAFEAALAASLNSLSNRFSDVGCPAEALAAIQEAVEVYERLATSWPEVEADLAMSWNNLAIRLRAVGREDESLAASTNAVEVYRRLAESREVFEPQLAASLKNLSSRLAVAGRRDQALAAIEQSVAIRRKLAGKRPAFEPELAGSLATWADQLVGTDPARAFGTAEDALRHLGPHCRKNPRRFADRADFCLSVYRRAATAAGRRIDPSILEHFDQ